MISVLLCCATSVAGTATAQAVSAKPDAAGPVTVPVPESYPSAAELTAPDLDEYGEVSPAPRDHNAGSGEDTPVASPPPDAPDPSLGDTRAPETRRYGAFHVMGNGSVQQFYYIRQDHYMMLVPNGTRAKSLTMLGAFGPHPVGASVRVRLGYNYYFFPVCAGNIADDRFLQEQALKSGETALKCPN